MGRARRKLVEEAREGEYEEIGCAANGILRYSRYYQPCIQFT